MPIGRQQRPRHARSTGRPITNPAFSRRSCRWRRPWPGNSPASKPNNHYGARAFAADAASADLSSIHGASVAKVSRGVQLGLLVVGQPLDLLAIERVIARQPLMPASGTSIVL